MTKTLSKPLANKPLANKPLAKPMLITRDHPLRGEAEALIRKVYDHEYQAVISDIADLIIAISGPDGHLLAAAGLRIGDGFFSEAYLDRPVEDVLSDFWRPPAARGEIAEISTLAAVHPYASHALFSALIGHLRAEGVRFAFCTVTERLFHMLKRVGVPAQELAPAKAERVANAESWGMYYAANPKVVAIHDAFVSMPATRPAATVVQAEIKDASVA
ncbi:thermostable hemolysin [Pseudomonadota bacterium]